MKNVKHQRRLDGYLSTSKYGLFDLSVICLLGQRNKTHLWGVELVLLPPSDVILYHSITKFKPFSYHDICNKSVLRSNIFHTVSCSYLKPSNGTYYFQRQSEALLHIPLTHISLNSTNVFIGPTETSIRITLNFPWIYIRVSYKIPQLCFEGWRKSAYFSQDRWDLTTIWTNHDMLQRLLSKLTHSIKIIRSRKYTHKPPT